MPVLLAQRGILSSMSTTIGMATSQERKVLLMVWIYYVAILVAAGLHLAIDKRARTPKRIVEIFLLYVLVIGVGVQSLLAFVGHTLLADQTAKAIGWPTGNPFQTEIAVANLSYGVLGILCIWVRRNFWYATGIGESIFGLGAACVHIREIILHHNYAPDNAGFILYSDIVLSVIILGLLLAYKVMAQPAQAQNVPTAQV